MVLAGKFLAGDFNCAGDCWTLHFIDDGWELKKNIFLLSRIWN
jgi:hypothetical protein